MGGVAPKELVELIAEYGNPGCIVEAVQYYTKVVNSGLQAPVDVSARLEVGGNLTVLYKGNQEIALLTAVALLGRIIEQYREQSKDQPKDKQDCFIKLLTRLGFALAEGKEYPVPCGVKVMEAEPQKLVGLLRLLADHLDKKGE